MALNIHNIKAKALTLLNWSAMGTMVILSSWIWLPIVTWKMGLILSDNIIKFFVND